jgi:hypothetical protein
MSSSQIRMHVLGRNELLLPILIDRRAILGTYNRST